LKISVCQLTDNLSPGQPAWRDLLRRIESHRPDVVLLNEMPFGPWLATEATFTADSAMASIQAHDSALQALRELPAAVISSRPVSGERKLANEAYLLADGEYRPLHQKHYFPQEPGFFEETWFACDRPGFKVAEYHGLRIGVLLCTEIMFTEWARRYRRQGAHAIVVPRASGTETRHWHAAAQMAAIVSGCYVLSSNRASDGASPRSLFGGRGFVYSPSGELLAETSIENPLICVSIDAALVQKAQRSYPCTVRELDA
jgi:predicted amidohydrolase